MSDHKIEKRFVYDGFGFDVVFRNVPMLKVRGVWTPKVDYNKLARQVVLALAHKPARLTGSEIRFILGLTRFRGQLSYAAFTSADFVLSYSAGLT